jgi:hypothetical protein
MISKENFIKYINKIKELRDIETKINEASKELDSFIISFSNHEQLSIDILQDLFEDKINDWIGFYIFDLNFGSKWEKDCITVNGKDVPMRDAGELYKVLIENINSKSKESNENVDCL